MQRKKGCESFLCGCVMWKLWYVVEGRGCSLRQKESRTEEIVCGLRRNGNGIKESECALGYKGSEAEEIECGLGRNGNGT